MKKILFLAAAAALCLGFSSAQERFVSEAAQNRKALLEEYTGIHCGYCPDGHRRANDLKKRYPDNFFIINIHTGGFAIPKEGEIDLRTQYGTALEENAGGSGYPSGSVSRHNFGGSAMATGRGSWATNVSEILDMPSFVNIAAKGTLDLITRELTVTVQLYYTGNATVSSNFIHVAVIQDSIIGTQTDYGNYNLDQTLPDGRYIHNHAFRDFLTGQWGDEITTVTKGSFVEKTYTKILPEIIGNVNVDLMNLNVIAFVTKTRNEVMNACQAEINRVDYEPFMVALAANDSAWGRVFQSGRGIYKEGDSVTITATPKAGCRFVNWTNGNEVFSTDSVHTFIVRENLELTAHFEKTQEDPEEAEGFRLSLFAGNPEQGYVFRSGNSCTYEEGDEVMILALPKEGYRFVNWTKGGAVFSKEALHTLSVTEDMELTAYFEKLPDDVAIGTPQEDDFHVYVLDHNIILSENRGLVQVFNAIGQCVYNGNATIIPVRQSGVYVVRAGANSHKVIVK